MLTNFFVTTATTIACFCQGSDCPGVEDRDAPPVAAEVQPAGPETIERDATPALEVGTSAIPGQSAMSAGERERLAWLMEQYEWISDAIRQGTDTLLSYAVLTRADLAEMWRHPFADPADRGTPLEGTVLPALSDLFWQTLPRSEDGRVMLTDAQISDFKTHVEQCLAEIQVAEPGALAADKLSTTIILKSAAIQASRTGGDPREAMRAAFALQNFPYEILSDEAATRFRLSLYGRENFDLSVTQRPVIAAADSE